VGAGSGVQVQDDDGDAGDLLRDNAASDSFSAFAAGYTGGVFVGFGKVEEAVYAAADTPRTIADVATTTSSIFVPPSAGIIQDLIVNISLMHAWNSDMDVTLTYLPSGTTIELFTDVGFNSDGMMLRLRDSAGTDIGAVAAPVDGVPLVGQFNPEGAAALSTFDGLDASGQWVLSITDDAAGETGTLYGWSLEISY
jgi:hypothetical protein